MTDAEALTERRSDCEPVRERCVKERDDETGFQYHSARYLAPWLGRWTSADPAGMRGGSNAYEYVSGNPAKLIDSTGREGKTVFLGTSKDEKYVARLDKVWGGNQYWSATGTNGAGWYVGIKGNQVLANPTVRIGVTTVDPPIRIGVTVPPPTCSNAPGRGGCPAWTVYVPPGRSGGSVADQMPDPVTAAVYKYLTEENPTAGKVVEGIQFVGGVVMLGADVDAALSQLSSGDGVRTPSLAPDAEAVDETAAETALEQSTASAVTSDLSASSGPGAGLRPSAPPAPTPCESPSPPSPPANANFRGVHAKHPALDAAKEGRVVPGDIHGTVTPEEHNAGGAADRSPYTSWSTEWDIVVSHADKQGPGGVILWVPRRPPPPGATWHWEWSPDEYGESEVLMHGTREGAGVIKR